MQKKIFVTFWLGSLVLLGNLGHSRAEICSQIIEVSRVGGVSQTPEQISKAEKSNETPISDGLPSFIDLESTEPRGQGWSSHCSAYCIAHALESRALLRDRIKLVVDVERDLPFLIKLERLMQIWEAKKGEEYLVERLATDVESLLPFNYLRIIMRFGISLLEAKQVSAEAKVNNVIPPMSSHRVRHRGLYPFETPVDPNAPLADPNWVLEIKKRLIQLQSKFPVEMGGVRPSQEDSNKIEELDATLSKYYASKKKVAEDYILKAIPPLLAAKSRLEAERIAAQLVSELWGYQRTEKSSEFNGRNLTPLEASQVLLGKEFSTRYLDQDLMVRVTLDSPNSKNFRKFTPYFLTHHQLRFKEFTTDHDSMVRMVQHSLNLGWPVIRQFEGHVKTILGINIVLSKKNKKRLVFVKVANSATYGEIQWIPLGSSNINLHFFYPAISDLKELEM